MKNSIRWNTMIAIVFTIAVITVMSYGVLVSTLKVWESTHQNKLTSQSLIQVIRQKIDRNNEEGDLVLSNYTSIGSDYSTSLAQWKTLEVFIPQWYTNDSKLELKFNSWSADRFISLELTKDNWNVSDLYASIDTRWWIILFDSSSWSEDELKEKREIQDYYIKQNNLSDLSWFILDEISKIWEVGSYVVFDFGSKKSINRFQFTATDDELWVSPNIIQLTFDNGVQHNFLIDVSKKRQDLFFPEITSRFVKLDILSHSNGRQDVSNANIINNISDNLEPEDIEISYINDTQFKISFPRIREIEGVNFLNIYTWYGWVSSENPLVSLLANETELTYNYSQNLVDSIYLELCSDIDICLNKVWISINN